MISCVLPSCLATKDLSPSLHEECWVLTLKPTLALGLNMVRTWEQDPWGLSPISSMGKALLA